MALISNISSNDNQTVFDILDSEEIHRRIQTKEPIYLKKFTDVHPQLVTKWLGGGGFKSIYQLENGKALAISKQLHEMGWTKVVKGEVAMSELLTKLGLLNPNLQLIEVALSADIAKGTFSSYVCDTFSHLPYYIIDTKNAYSSTWKEGENFLFQNDVDRLQEANWDSVLAPFLDDIEKICRYGIQVGNDSINLAILQIESSKTASQYQIRFFGFDFDISPAKIPNMEDRSIVKVNEKKIIFILRKALDCIFNYEFGYDRYNWSEESNKLMYFKDSIQIKTFEQLKERLQDIWMDE